MINFANFIAFPITFGIGVDYAVNVIARYMQDGERDVTGAVRSTGGAVALCSMTTIIGYSSLLLAKNRALSLLWPAGRARGGRLLDRSDPGAAWQCSSSCCGARRRRRMSHGSRRRASSRYRQGRS